MMAAQNTQAQQQAREEERVLGISYERAHAMIPRLVAGASGGTVEELGDGYFLASTQEGSMKRELTVRLGRQAADTRFSVRVESSAAPWALVGIIAFTMLTMGLGILFVMPFIVRAQRREARQRELLIHKTFRAIEEAVAEQGVSTSYRIAPGADARAPRAEVVEEEQADEGARASKRG